MRLFDTHAHYDSGAFDADRQEVLASMPGRGVELILDPGCDLESSESGGAGKALPLRLRRRGGPPL